MEKTYQYWFFYIKPEFKDFVCTESDDSLLYAYTDKKEYAKIFESMRDMEKFFKKKRKISRDEVGYLADTYNKEFLIYKSFETKKENGGIQNCNLLLTKMEYFIIDRDYTEVCMNRLWLYTWINPKIFKDEYKKALEEIGYTFGYDMISNTKREKSAYQAMELYKPDYISAFIHHFGFLLKMNTR